MNNTTQQSQMQWYKKREQWRKVTKPYPQKSTDIYKPNELNMEACDMINSIIVATKGPYPAFPKKIKLVDLVALVQQIWQDND